MAHIIRVDPEVYRLILERKGELERQNGRVVSFNEVLRERLLDATNGRAAASKE